MKIAICDDEFYQRNLLRNITEKLSKEMSYRIKIDEFTSGEQLVRKIERDTYAYDIILLDIQMKELTGIDTAKIIRASNQSTIIIFITGVADYVFEGYNVRAFNYILKPIDEKKVKTVLTEAIKTFQVEDKPYYTITTKEATYKIELDEIIYFVSDKRLIKAVTSKGEYEFYGRLDETEDKLVDKEFVRCHQRYLVNAESISQIEGSTIIIEGSIKIPISRNRYKETMIAFARGLMR